RRIRVRVPAAAPPGVHTLTVKAGSFPDGSESSARVTIEKTGTAATPGEGPPDVWAVAWEGAEPAAAEAAAGEPAVRTTVSPNPFRDRTAVRFTLPEAADVRVEVLDALGRRVALLADGRLDAGPQALTWEAGAAPAGVYLIPLTAGTTVRSQRGTRLR